MTVQLDIEYDKLVELVKQLPDAQQKDLIAQLLSEQAQKRPLTVEEKIQLLDAAKLDSAVNEEPSVRREDWYGDDGR
jgi:hypothetical protein